MKWFKHFSKMHLDVKIKRLIEKHGVEGYGVYNFILESIAFNLESTKPTPEIEEGSIDLAKELKIDTLKLEAIICTCVSEKLFEINPVNNRIMCLKLLKHLDNTLSVNPEIKKILLNFNKLQETLSFSKQIRLDKININKALEPFLSDPDSKKELNTTRQDSEQENSDEPDINFNFPSPAILSETETETENQEDGDIDLNEVNHLFTSPEPKKSHPLKNVAKNNPLHVKIQKAFEAGYGGNLPNYTVEGKQIKNLISKTAADENIILLLMTTFKNEISNRKGRLFDQPFLPSVLMTNWIYNIVFTASKNKIYKPASAVADIVGGRNDE